MRIAYRSYGERAESEMRSRTNTISRMLDGLLTALFLTALAGAILSVATLLFHYPKNVAERQELRGLRQSQVHTVYDNEPVALPHKKPTAIRHATF